MSATLCASSVEVSLSTSELYSPPSRTLTRLLHPPAAGAADAADVAAAAQTELAAAALHARRPAEASLLRTAVMAHASLRTAEAVTQSLAKQDETLTAIEVCVAENDETWRRGRSEMRRTKHWYAALWHCLCCRNGAALAQVASKSKRSPPPLLPPPSQPTLTPASVLVHMVKPTDTLDAATVDVEPEMDALHRAALRDSAATAGAAFNEDEDSARADAALLMRMEPMLDEVRGVVAELHERATSWNGLLASQVDRLDTLNTKVDKTCINNTKTGLRRS